VACDGALPLWLVAAQSARDSAIPRRRARQAAARRCTPDSTGKFTEGIFLVWLDGFADIFRITLLREQRVNCYDVATFAFRPSRPCLFGADTLRFGWLLARWRHQSKKQTFSSLTYLVQGTVFGCPHASPRTSQPALIANDRSRSFTSKKLLADWSPVRYLRFTEGVLQ